MEAARAMPYFGALVGAVLALALTDPTPGLVLLILGALIAVVQEIRALAQDARGLHHEVTALQDETDQLHRGTARGWGRRP